MGDQKACERHDDCGLTEFDCRMADEGRVPPWECPVALDTGWRCERLDWHAVPDEHRFTSAAAAMVKTVTVYGAPVADLTRWSRP